MENINNYFVKPGYLIFTESPYIISTVLGSCVSLCVWDKVNKYGGMNHIVYPYNFSSKAKITTEIAEPSIKTLLKYFKERNSKKEDLIVHLIGGASSESVNSTIGKENIKYSKDILKKYNIKIISEDTGGSIGRKVIFHTYSGEVIVYKVNKIRNSDWYGK